MRILLMHTRNQSYVTTQYVHVHVGHDICTGIIHQSVQHIYIYACFKENLFQQHNLSISPQTIFFSLCQTAKYLLFHCNCIERLQQKDNFIKAISFAFQYPFTHLKMASIFVVVVHLLHGKQCQHNFYMNNNARSVSKARLVLKGLYAKK